MNKLPRWLSPSLVNTNPGFISPYAHLEPKTSRPLREIIGGMVGIVPQRGCTTCTQFTSEAHEAQEALKRRDGDAIAELQMALRRQSEGAGRKDALRAMQKAIDILTKD